MSESLSDVELHAGKKQRIVEPVGVIVVEEDEEPVLHAPEMQRLLRQPRCASFTPIHPDIPRIVAQLLITSWHCGTSGLACCIASS